MYFDPEVYLTADWELEAEMVELYGPHIFDDDDQTQDDFLRYIEFASNSGFRF